MDVGVLTYRRDDNGKAQQIKYLVDGQSVYLFLLGDRYLSGWQESAIKALLKEGMGHPDSKFFAVLTQVAWPDSSSLGSPCVLKQIIDKGDGRVLAFTRVECPKKVLKAFRAEILQAV